MSFFKKYIYAGDPKKLLKRIGTIFVVLVVALIMKSWNLAKESNTDTSTSGNKGNEFDRQVLIITLKETERQISQNLPQQVDDITVLNRVMADETTLKYFYKIDGAYESSEWSRLMESELIKFVCGNPGMKNILIQGGNYEFNYADKNEDTLASIKLPLSKCTK